MWDIQKQPSRGVLRKRCSENMQQIYRRTPMPTCDFNKVAKQLWSSLEHLLGTSLEGCFWRSSRQFLSWVDGKEIFSAAGKDSKKYCLLEVTPSSSITKKGKAMYIRVWYKDNNLLWQSSFSRHHWWRVLNNLHMFIIKSLHILKIKIYSFFW